MPGTWQPLQLPWKVWVIIFRSAGHWLARTCSGKRSRSAVQKLPFVAVGMSSLWPLASTISMVAPGVGFVLQRGLDVRALENGHRLVVAGDGPVDGELERLGLAANGGEDGLAAHAGGFGDGVDGGRAVAALGEQACGGVDDGAAGGTGLRRAQRGGVGLLDRCGHFR